MWSSVHFCSKWYLCARKSTYALHPICQKFPPMLPLKQFQSSSDWEWPSLVLSRKIVERFFFPRLSPRGDRWCDVLGFVPAGSVSSSSTRPIFWQARRMWTSFSSQSVCWIIFLHSGISKAVHAATGAFEGGCQTLTYIAVWASHPAFYFLQQAYCICKDNGMCGLTVTSLIREAIQQWA